MASAPGYTRLVRASVLAAARAEHLEATRATGANRWHVAVRHVLPATAPTVAVYATVGLGAAVGQATALRASVWVRLGDRPVGAIVYDATRYAPAVLGVLDDLFNAIASRTARDPGPQAIPRADRRHHPEPSGTVNRYK